MHPNSAFRPDNQTESLAFAREAGFGLLAVEDAGAAPMLSHVPFLLSEDGGSAELHLVRSNPIARALPEGAEGRAAKLAVQGPHGYVSPDWYEIEGQVPTWNYVAVHLTGTLEALPQGDLPGLLERQSAHFEAAFAPKPPWTMDKLTPEVARRMYKQIRPFRLMISRIDSTWKLGQNKPDTARLAAAKQIAAQSIGQDTRLLSALMRNPPE